MYNTAAPTIPSPPPPPPPPMAPLMPISSSTTATDGFNSTETLSSVENSQPVRSPLPATGVPVNHPQRLIPAKWSTGLLGCFDDIGNCCLTCLCPCVTFGRIAEVVDGGTTTCCASGSLYALIMCLTGCSCLYSCFYRSKLRGQHLLEESPCSDCLVHCCCESCALCQEYRELKNRGINPKLGWKQRVWVMPPVVEANMNR